MTLGFNSPSFFQGCPWVFVNHELSNPYEFMGSSGVIFPGLRPSGLQGLTSEEAQKSSWGSNRSIELYVCASMYTWNPFVLYFGDLTLQNKVFSIQNRGHLGSRYM